MQERVYIAIDLKSFFASVECVERKLDPLNTNLVVADKSRTEKTICLAVTPSLKQFSIPGRARLFEVVSRVKEVNAERQKKAPKQEFRGSSVFQDELKADPSLKLDYIVAPPRMAKYVDYSRRIYKIYLKYVAPEDIHVYSIDEVMMDVTAYLQTYGLSAAELAKKMIQDVYENTGITATAGIGTNLYLAKIAMDIMAKHAKPDENGVRMAYLDERLYREKLWNHRPLTDFWRVGNGYRKKLEKYGMYTMGDVARCSVGRPDEYWNEELLYRLFGINAELLIDHAWGYEPCTLEHVKAYKPSVNSLCSGQVLKEPYEYQKGRIIVQEMTELLTLDLVEKELVTDQLVLTVGYDIENIKNQKISRNYQGEVVTDHYGRCVPKSAHGTKTLDAPTSSTKLLTDAVLELYDSIVNPALLIRRVNLSANRLVSERELKQAGSYEQLSLFQDDAVMISPEKREELEKEKRMQQAMIRIKQKFGKNAILKGINLVEGATTIERNSQIGGHSAGRESEQQE